MTELGVQKREKGALELVRQAGRQGLLAARACYLAASQLLMGGPFAGGTCRGPSSHD